MQGSETILNSPEDRYETHQKSFRMVSKGFLFSIFTTTLLSFGVWIVVFYNTSPLTADKLTFAAFYASLFLWISGLLTFLLYYIRSYFSRGQLVYSHLPSSVRQATLISLGLVSLLFFQSLGVLNWWEVGLWITALLLLEMFFRSSGQKIS